MEKTEKLIIGSHTQEEINRLKAQYGRIYAIELTDYEGQERVAYFRHPDLSTMSAMSKMGKTDEVRAGQILIENTFVGGDATVKTDTALFLGAMGELSKIVTASKAKLKNV